MVAFFCDGGEVVSILSYGVGSSWHRVDIIVRAPGLALYKVRSLLPFLSSPKLLTNESEAELQSGLQSLLSELDNPSPLAVALVSQLDESLWWIKRHTVDKELLLHEAMTKLLSKPGSFTETYDNRKVSEALENYLDGSEHKD